MAEQKTLAEQKAQPHYVNKAVVYRGHLEGEIDPIPAHPSDANGKEYTVTLEHLSDVDYLLLMKKKVYTVARTSNPFPGTPGSGATPKESK
jgi:hypothetical protein